VSEECVVEIRTGAVERSIDFQAAVRGLPGKAGDEDFPQGMTQT
jgi:hypothetical protein